MKVYVGNLAMQINDAELNTLVTPFGEITSAVVVTDKTSGQSKGFGFVEFNSAAGGNAAITALNGRDVHGLALKVNEAKPKAAPVQA